MPEDSPVQELGVSEVRIGGRLVVLAVWAAELEGVVDFGVECIVVFVVVVDDTVVV